MAVTFKLISKTELTATAATVTFTSIPQTYDDLYLVISANTTNTGRASTRVSFNGYTGNSPAAYQFQASGTSVTAERNTGGSGEFYIYPGAGNTASTGFSGCEVYMPKYTNATANMPIMLNSVLNENGTTPSNFLLAGSVLYNYAVAKTSITLALFSSAVFNTNSSFMLYGIKNS